MMSTKRARSKNGYIPPAVDDVNPAYAGSWTLSRLERLIGYVRTGRPVWWHRERFHAEPFKDAEPAWHLFTGRTRGDGASRWDFTWQAACGYTRVRPEVIFGLFDFKATAPSKAARCQKCDALYADHLAHLRQSRSSRP